MLGVLFVITYFCLPETYHPILLQKKAALLREKTADPQYYSPADREEFSIKSLVTKTLARPILMFTEPIVFAMSYVFFFFPFPLNLFALQMYTDSYLSNYTKTLFITRLWCYLSVIRTVSVCICRNTWIQYWNRFLTISRCCVGSSDWISYGPLLRTEIQNCFRCGWG